MNALKKHIEPIRRGLLIGLSVTMFGLGGCGQPRLVQEASEGERPIPPTDAAQPALTETATFALG